MAYRGKFSHGKRRFPIISWMMILLAVLSLSTGAVTAYLSWSTSTPVENKFEMEETLDPSIQETFSNQVKSNVKVSVGNTDYSVYVRASIVVNWKYDHGNVSGQYPVEGKDYKLSLNTNDWFEKDGFYYCKTPVNSGEMTPVLINTCKQVGTAPDGYFLSVEIIAQTIQALGTTDVVDGTGNVPAVTDAWGVIVKNGQLSPQE